ncbi:MAG: pilin [Patescibacteria group bacterium]
MVRRILILLATVICLTVFLNTLSHINVYATTNNVTCSQLASMYTAPQKPSTNGYTSFATGTSSIYGFNDSSCSIQTPVSSSSAIIYKTNSLDCSTGCNVTFYYQTSSSSSSPYTGPVPTFNFQNIINPTNGITGGNAITQIMSLILPIVYGVVGIIVFALILYAGFLWMTSQGDTQKIDRAKSVLTGAAIGATIIFLAYAISLLAVHL